MYELYETNNTYQRRLLHWKPESLNSNCNRRISEDIQFLLQLIQNESISQNISIVLIRQMINMSTTDNTAIYNNRYDNTIIGVINVFLSDINADTFNYFPQCLQKDGETHPPGDVVFFAIFKDLVQHMPESYQL